MLETLLMLGTVLGSIGNTPSTLSVPLNEGSPIVENTSESNTSETSRPNIKMRRINDVGDIFEIELSYDKAIETINVVDNINVQVKDELINGSKLNLLLQSNSKISKLNVIATLEDETNISQPIFAYREQNKVFVSSESEDNAWFDSMKYYADEIGEYDEEDVVKSYDDFTQHSLVQDNSVSYGISTFSSNSSNDSVTVKGQLTWQDENMNTHPLKNIRVELYDKDIWFLEEYLDYTYTDLNGNFSFTFQNADDWYFFENGGYDPFIRFFPDGKTFGVGREWVLNALTVDFYYGCSDIISDVKNNSTTTFNICVAHDPDNLANNAFSISQAMTEAQNFANSAAGMPLNKYPLLVAYPGTVTSFSWKPFCAIEKNRWNDWGTIIHEYGHYVENIMGTYGASLGEIIWNNPTHSSSKDHLNDKKQKEYAMELTWSEAWATTFAMIAYDNLNLSNISYASSIKSDIDYYGDRFSPSSKESGEGQEDAVIAYLWNLYDSDNDDKDQVSLGTKTFFDTTLKDKMYTLTDFVKNFETNYQEYIAASGQLLEESQISPEIVPFTSVADPNKPLEIKFYPNGSSYNPNNEFEIQFFSNEGRLVGTIPSVDVTVNGNQSVVTYTVRQELWNFIYLTLEPYPYVYVSVIGYHNEEPKSGPYRSGLEVLQIHESLSISPGEYDFPEGYCTSEEEKEVTIGDVTFNTKRLRTGFIENEYINLCPRKEGFGTAYLEFEFDKPVTGIDINLSFWSDDERYYAADNPEASIDYWDDSINDWDHSLDLLEANMPTDRTNQKTYSIKFDKPTTKFRIYAHFNNMTGYTDRNKGRISIGNMVIYFN
jgi:hypothetical protein